jgi:(1->4)-alpha-D-glucan 1-alpha-D-glucosylmutase
MTERIATYRLQFREGTTFDSATEIVPYLQRLGVSHLYASPLFTATAGSTHGYDVVDYNEIDPDIGGREGFDRLSEALKRAGIGLLLDIVPNHMAASPENAWWRDCIEWGPAARHSAHFDIDWSRRLTLPVLGAAVDEVIAAGELSVGVDPEGRGLALTYWDNAFPLTPPSYRLLAEAGAPLRSLTDAAEVAQPEEADAFHARMHGELAGGRYDTALRHISNDRALIARLHDAQPYALTDWREARTNLSYRRFFEVTGLVGTRVEDEAVFDDVHRLTLDLVRSGQVDGLRVDHVDGLSDPAAYLARLREAVGPDVWLVVEKIVEGDETLPDWPVEGTTGYEFIAAMSDLLLSRPGAAELEAAYAELSTAPPAAQRRDAAKRQIVVHNFEGELGRLVSMIVDQTGAEETLVREGLVALIVALPVYRTYGTAEGFSEADLEVLRPALSAASEAAPGAGAVLDALSAPAAWELRARFQQLTGPAMAKAVEDTLFYRHAAILAYNEVGCDPVHPPARSLDVHAQFAARRTAQPEGLTATATHDTKRGEDSRARLYTLSERPQDWLDGVERWRQMAAGAVRRGVPEPANEWAIYQALAGIWPEGRAPHDAETLEGLRERFLEYKVKALREAKLRTTWTEEDEAYETAIEAYIDALFDPENTVFRNDFHATVMPFAQAGRITGLTQTLLKLTVPGVPDIYQGSETGDFSLVDPDNRRPVDFSAVAAALEEADPRAEPLTKPAVIEAMLPLRRRFPELFSHGTYTPLPAEGGDAGLWFAFERAAGENRAVVIATMRGLRFLEAVERGTSATLHLPPADAGWRGVFSPTRLEGGAAITLPRDIGGRPVEVLLPG